MTNKIMFSNDYVGIVTVGLYNATTDPEFSYYSTSPDIEVGIVSASNLYVSGIVSTTNLKVGVATASEFYGNFIGTVAGTASTASFATTSFNLSGSPNISVGVITATGGFISSASTTPIQINYDAATTSIVFSITGIGTTSLRLY